MNACSAVFYVYELRDETGRVFYVGKGSGSRMHAHERRARRGERSHRSHVIRQILARGGEVNPVVVFTSESEADAFAEEKRLIAFYGRAALTNKTDGGDGISNPSDDVRERIAASRRGKIASEETRLRQRLAKLGTHRTDETKAKIAAFQKNQPKPWARAVAVENAKKRPFLGKRHTPETIEKMRKAKRGHVVTEETRRKISETKKRKAAIVIEREG